MIGIVIPAHNEAAHIGACVTSARVAARSPALVGESVRILVVLDSCDDATGVEAVRAGADTLAVAARNVGIARAMGADALLDAGARWLAFTDADTEVAPDWVATQLACGVDAVCGTITVREWGAYGVRMAEHFGLTYTDREGHTHVHGANLGVSAEAYRRAGGFSALASSEDVALVDALRRSGARITWSAAPRVVTSARADFRAPGGFGETLARIERERAWVTSPPPHPVAAGVA